MNRGGGRSRSGSERRDSIKTGIVEAKRSETLLKKKEAERQYD